MSRAGDLDPTAAWERLAAEPETVLVDVRTRAEWSFVGMPDLGSIGKRVVPIEWVTFPDGDINPAFLEQLRATVPQDATVLFLCRSGGRSVDAAETAARAGYDDSWNVTEGFEGGHDADGHRQRDGWKNSGLPWWQG